MKSKIALITLFVVILNSVFCYADSDYSFNSVDSSKVVDAFSILRQEYNYDSKTDTYYFPTNDDVSSSSGNTRVGAVAVTGSVVSSVLALAVKAGLEFATSNSMSEFVGRFFMLDGISSVVDGIQDVVKKSVGGTLEFSRSLLDTVSSKFSEIMTQNKVSSVYLNGRKFQVIKYTGTSTIDDTTSRYLFESSVLPKISFDLGEMKTVYQYYDSSISLPTTTVFGDFSVRARKYRDSTPYKDTVQIVLKTSDGSYQTIGNTIRTAVEFPTDTFLNGFKAYAVPVLGYATGSRGETYYVGLVVAIYSQVTGRLSAVKGKISEEYIPGSHFGTTSTLPVIGSAWSGGSIEGSDSGSGNLSIKIPKDTNDLVGKKPSDISTPSYETWTPGVSVVPPSIDTGVDAPPVDDVLPPIVDDVPSDDSGTDTPGDSVDTDNPNAWNWLKELLEKLLDFIKTIVDWLTSFWDKLTEFLISLLVPDDRYFVDSLSEIIDLLSEKIPSIDIYKLHSLAVGETKFEDIYANFFGVKCLVVKGSVINNIVPWIRAIGQGIVGLFLLLYNYNQIYQLIRGGALYGNNYIKISDKG